MISERLHILVERPLWLSAASTEFRMFVAAAGQCGLLPKKPKSHYLIDAAPLPYLNTPLFALLSISPVLIGALVPLLWDLLKQRLDSKHE